MKSKSWLALIIRESQSNQLPTSFLFPNGLSRILEVEQVLCKLREQLGQVVWSFAVTRDFAWSSEIYTMHIHMPYAGLCMAERTNFPSQSFLT